MSLFVEKGECPNMPVTYKAITCNTRCELIARPELLERCNGYNVVINELANSDFRTWLINKLPESLPPQPIKPTRASARPSRARASTIPSRASAVTIPVTIKHASGIDNGIEYESLLIQMMLSIYCFHGLGYIHKDCHMGNFLIHKVDPGGHWWYNVGGYDLYVPNVGYLLVLWDPGQAEEMKEPMDYIYDYNSSVYSLNVGFPVGKYNDFYQKIFNLCKRHGLVSSFGIPTYIAEENIMANFFKDFVKTSEHFTELKPSHIINENIFDMNRRKK
jgi:hypothetical protein